LYQEAAKLDPTNRTAIDGMAQTELMVSGTGQGDIMDRELVRKRVRSQAIRWSFDQAVADANAAIARRDFNAAQEALDRARVAKESDPTVFSQQDLANFDSVIANTQLRLTRAQETGRITAEQTATTEAQRDAAERARIEALERRRTVQILVRTAKQLIYDGQYQQAEGVLNQILAIDPTNDYAVGVKQLVADNAKFQEQRRLREKHDREFDRQLNTAEEKKIPYTDILVYPTNWPDISDLRDRESRTERSGGAAGNEQAMLELNKVLPEVRFDNAALADVVDFMRDVTGADIAVNWSTLEAAGINKKAPVKLDLRNKKGQVVLKQVLASISGPAKLGYTLEDGIVKISTEEEIKSRTTTQVYDIRDLLVVAPDFDAPPEFSLTTSNNSGRGKGNRGGHSGPGTFGTFSGGASYASSNTAKYDSTGSGATATATPGKVAKTDELVQEITNVIKRQVDPDSWIDNGGKHGSLTYLSGQLIVTASPENQTRVVSLLDKLREAAAIQVSIETRFLTIQRNFLEDIGIDLDFFFNINNPTHFSPIVVQQGSFPFTATPTTPTPGSIGSTAQPGIQVQGSFLDDFQVNFLIRATQASINSTTLTAPRVTVFNGQQAFVLVAQQQAYVSDLEAVTGDGVGLFNPIIDTVQTGVRLVVQPTVSADRKYVTLSLQPQVSQLVGLSNFPVFGLANQNNNQGGGGNNNQIFQASVQLPILDITSVNTIVSVPDGGTLLLGGQTLAGETEVEEGVPILSKIPFIKRLFTNRSTAKDERILLILVKPTIIIQREVEQQQFPLLGTRTRT
jgi:general secretion pathway protein D